MATYSLGIQFGLELGAFAWGVRIDALGYPSACLGAIVVMVLVLVLTIASSRRGQEGHARH